MSLFASSPSFSQTNSRVSSPLRDQLKRDHSFESRMIVKLDSCLACGRRIAFGKKAYKCRECKSLVHLECRSLVPLPCIPVVSLSMLRM